MNRTVYIMVGASGSGKSTWIANNCDKSYNNGICSADHYFYDEDDNYNFNPSKLPAAHQHCLRMFLSLIQAPDVAGGIQRVYVDNTNTTLQEIAPYVRLAQALHWNVKVVAFNPDEPPTDNVHGVPGFAVGRMWRNVRETLPRLHEVGIYLEDIIEATR